MGFDLNPIKALTSTISTAFDAVGHLAKGDVMGAVSTVAGAVDDIVPDAGDLFEDLADEFLPPDLEWVGDVLSGLANMGNPVALLSDLADLADNFQGAEPPNLARPPQDLVALEGDPGVVSRDPPNVAVDHGSPAPTQQSGSSAPGVPNTSSSATASGSDAGASSSDPQLAAEERKLKNETAGQAAAADFIKKYAADPEGFMTAIKEGKIPPEVLNSQVGMMMLQERMGEINRMFQMMTQMMDAMHQMNMAIVRNIRAS
jgi:hypothetical protein